jgi:general secretion pathway protein J
VSRASSHRGQRAFTLLELLVAMAIFAVVGVLALSGYTELQQQSEYAEQRLDRVREVQRAVQTIMQDFSQLEPRPIREPLGEGYLPAVQAGVSVDYRIEFTRAGWSNTAGLARPTLQRVGYRVDQDGLWRDYWPVLDRTLSVEPVRQKLLGGVSGVAIRFLGTNREWLDRWPAETAGGAPDLRARPAAVEITLDLEDWGEVRRLIEIAG